MSTCIECKCECSFVLCVRCRANELLEVVTQERVRISEAMMRRNALGMTLLGGSFEVKLLDYATWIADGAKEGK